MKRRDFVRAGLCTAALYGMGLPAVASLLPPDPFFAQSFTDLDGNDVAMSHYRGKPLIVNFWATWCKPCVEEMPDLQALHQAYPQVQFLGLGIDRAQNMRDFLQKVQVDYDVLVAGHGGIAIMRALGNRPGGLPFTVAFNADGRVQNRMLGQINPEKLADVIQTLLAK